MKFLSVVILPLPPPAPPLPWILLFCPRKEQGNGEIRTRFASATTRFVYDCSSIADLFRKVKTGVWSFSVFTHSPRDESPVHVVSPEQFIAAEQRHEQERVIAKQEKERTTVKDGEALRVSLEQLREVLTCIWVFNTLVKEINTHKDI